MWLVIFRWRGGSVNKEVGDALVVKNPVAFFGGLDKEIALLYGEAGSGKTTFALQAAISIMENKGKVLFFDTEQGFSPERFRQLYNGKEHNYADHFVRIPLAGFQEQYHAITKFAVHTEKFQLLVVDTLGNHYRREVKENALAANRVMDRHLRVLYEISKHIPVLLTNQVYSNVENGEIVSVGGKMVLKWCSKVVELQRDPRVMVMKKPYDKRISFTIADCGLIPE